jgi:hypothetical protein
VRRIKSHSHRNGDLCGLADERLSRLHIDGVPCTYRDRQEFAIEAARRLMTKYPHTVT